MSVFTRARDRITHVALLGATESSGTAVRSLSTSTTTGWAVSGDVANTTAGLLISCLSHSRGGGESSRNKTCCPGIHHRIAVHHRSLHRSHPAVRHQTRGTFEPFYQLFSRFHSNRKAYDVTGLAASVALATTTSGSTTETGTASSGSSGAGRGDVTLLSTGVTRLSLGSGALAVS